MISKKIIPRQPSIHLFHVRHSRPSFGHKRSATPGFNILRQHSPSGSITRSVEVPSAFVIGLNLTAT